MKVRLVSREPATGVFIVSKLVELEEMEALAGRVKSNAVQALGEGLIDIVPGEASLGRLFPDGEAGMVVAMFLSQEEMQEKRMQKGMERLFNVGRRRKPMVKRRR